MDRVVLEVVNLFCTGIFAGMEFIVCFGVRDPQCSGRTAAHPGTSSTDKEIACTGARCVCAKAISVVGVAVVEGTARGSVCRCAGVLAVVIWTLATFHGTVPINVAVLTWRPDAHPRIGRG